MFLAVLLGGQADICAAVALGGHILRPDRLQLAALVTVRDVDHGLAWTLQSASSGTFRIENLPAGHYEVTVRSPNLPTHVLPVAEVHEDTEVSIRLESGPTIAALTNANMLAHLPREKGDARRLLRFHCIQCHGLELIASSAKTPEQWNTTVQTMAARVPPAPVGQMDIIAEYLALQFGPQKRAAVPLTGLQQFAFEANAIMVELDLPKAGAHPHDIRLGPDGNLWVADFDVRPNLEHNSLFRIDPRTLDIRTLTLGVAATGARSIAFGPGGVPWVTILFGNLLVKLDSEFQDPKAYEIPGDKFWPHSVAFAPDGGVWVSGMWADKLARFDPSSETFSLVKVPTERSMLYDLEIDRSGVVWYTGLFAHKLGRYDPRTGNFTEFATPTQLSSTRYLDIGPDGQIWVALFAAGRIGRFDPATETFEEIMLPDANSSPYDLRASATEGVWYTDFTRNSVAQFDPRNAKLREYSIPSSPYARPTEMERDTEGRIWFCENGTGKVGYVDENALARTGVYRVPDSVARRLVH